jgi:hypothetical protein
VYLPSVFVFIVIALIIVAGLASLPWTPTAVVIPIVIGVLVLGFVIFILRSGGGLRGGWGRGEPMG